MNTIVIPMLFSVIGLGSNPCGDPVKKIKQPYLYEPAYAIDDVLRGKPQLYKPQAGDFVFFYEDNDFWHVMYKVAFTGPPYHVAVVVLMPNGEYRLLESGPNDTFHVRLCPMGCRLQRWHGSVYIRRRVQPLTAHESNQLTEYAIRQNGKRYAIVRLGAQITPLRSRGPLRSFFLGHSCPDSSSFLCAECVIEASIYAGLFKKEDCRPCATYPEDMFYDHSRNLFLNKHFKLAPNWDPPQRWTVDPVTP